MLYRIVLSYATFGVITTKFGIVVKAAPIAKWMIGKQIQVCYKWVLSKHGRIDPCN